MGSVPTVVFAMGEFQAEFPTDRSYITNHMWAVQRTATTLRFGLSAYAVRLLQDVYFLDWTVDIPSRIGHRQCLGSIESKKAESDLFAPCGGVITSVNPEALDDPSVINVDPYGEGWLLEMEAESPQLLSPQQYLTHLDSAWKVAERTIKGQIQ